MSAKIRDPYQLISSSLTLLIVLAAGCIQPQSPTTSHNDQPIARQGESHTPPQAPILRLETGMHTQRISRVGLDQENRYVVTASSDKTVRVWERGTGQLIRTLRPPIGKNNEGKLFAAAISPNGRTIVCAGWTGAAWDQAFSIYLFDRASGRLVRRISNLPASVSHLAYSPDGQLLVVTFHGRNGIHIYRTTDYNLIAEDRSYGAESYGASFDRLGRLVTTSYDGFIRLYDYDFQLKSRTKVPGGKRPFAIKFSPDGEKIAIGFEYSSHVNVLSGEDLSFLYAPNVHDIRPGQGALNSIAWSNDGQVLYAGGTFRLEGTHLIRKWDNQGKGPSHDLPATHNTILDLVAIKDGGILYSASGGAFGAFDKHDDHIFSQKATIPDYRDNRNGLLLSANGATVQFSSQQWGKQPTTFSITSRLLESAGLVHSLIPPITTSSTLTVQGWSTPQVSTATSPPTLNGHAIPLDRGEIARGFAITPDHQAILVGTAWSLRLFDQYRQELWATPISGDAWSINVAQDGRVAVVTLGDGTIRWYRMTDGQEILALFPHPDQRRWVLWTPSGYYDAAPGADNFIGWHKNYGPDTAADFFPIAQFRTVSYRPDVIAKLTESWDEQQAIRLANEEARQKAQVITYNPNQIPPKTEKHERIEKERKHLMTGLRRMEEQMQQRIEALTKEIEQPQQRAGQEELKRKQQEILKAEQERLKVERHQLSTISVDHPARFPTQPGRAIQKPSASNGNNRASIQTNFSHRNNSFTS
ncbi:MAG: hypothetical protein GKS05_08800 [Nitrospirales bacterium]|nr:hypothetical protein [Nitrospirales bacterium]